MVGVAGLRDGIPIGYFITPLSDPRLREGATLGPVPTLTIPGVETLHQRAVWEPVGYRMGEDFHRRPPLYVPGNVTRGAIHYSAAIDLPDGDLGEFDYQIGPWLAAVTRDYLTNRDEGGYRRTSDGVWFPGYPIGYSFAFDNWGGVWVLRGFDFLPAATNGHNHYTVACLMLTDRPDEASPLAWASVRAVLREARRLANRNDFANRPWGHGEFHANTGIGTPTACPGPANLGQVHAGLADLDHSEGDDEMQYLEQPERAMDTRPDKVHQDRIDVVLAPFNAKLPRKRLTPGKPLKVFVGMERTYEVAVTVVGASGSGWVEVTGTDDPPTTSCGNFYPSKPTDCQTVGVSTSDGHVRVWVGGTADAAADIVVDVRGRV